MGAALANTKQTWPLTIAPRPSGYSTSSGRVFFLKLFNGQQVFGNASGEWLLDSLGTQTYGGAEEECDAKTKRTDCRVRPSGFQLVAYFSVLSHFYRPCMQPRLNNKKAYGTFLSSD